MKINLHDLAAELSISDLSEGKNLDVIDVEIVLSALGKKLRSIRFLEAINIVLAIYCRAGK